MADEMQFTVNVYSKCHILTPLDITCRDSYSSKVLNDKVPITTNYDHAKNLDYMFTGTLKKRKENDIHMSFLIQ